MKRKNILKDFKKWYFNRNRMEKTLFWSFLGLLLISCIFIFGVQAWNGYHGLNIDKNECVNIGVQTALSFEGQSYWMILLTSLLPVIKFLILAIGLAWILHGFQLRVFA